MGSKHADKMALGTEGKDGGNLGIISVQMHLLRQILDVDRLIQVVVDIVNTQDDWL